MRHLFMLISLFLVSFAAFGCQRTDPAPQSQMHQVLGALQIPGRAERDAALAAACRECAAIADAQSVLLGIPRIEDKKLRDEVVKDCVATFVAADNSDVARELAELITDPALRVEVLSSLPA